MKKLSLYQKFLELKKEIEKHKWIEESVPPPSAAAAMPIDAKRRDAACPVDEARSVCAGHLAQLALAHRAGPVEGHHMVDLRADADPFAHRVVVVAGHMGHHGVAALQAQGVEKF